MRKTMWILGVGMAALILAGVTSRTQNVRPETAAPPSGPAAVKANIEYGRMPLYFIANQGQMDERVSFYVQGKDKSLYFTEGGVTFVLSKQEPDQTAGKAEEKRERPLREETRQVERHVVKLDFVGANTDVRPSGEEKTEAVISYFKGNPEDWHTGLPTYSRIVYRNLWPGIDLVYSGTVNKLKY